MAKLKVTNPPLLVCIKWLDAVSGPNTWEDYDGCCRLLPVVSFTAGFLIDMDSEYLTICGTYNLDDNLSQRMTIPLSIIQEVDILSSKTKLVARVSDIKLIERKHKC